MLLDYVQAAMRRAKYKLLPDNEGVFAKIPGFRGLWAHATTVEGCREELQSVLEDWLVVKLRHNDGDLPILGKINLNASRSGAKRKQRSVA